MSVTHYVLHVDGVGEFAMKNSQGGRCLFLFTSQQAVTVFVERMELPTHKEFTAIPFDAESLARLLSEPIPGTQMVAIDPPSKFEFTPMNVNEFLNRLRNE